MRQEKWKIKLINSIILEHVYNEKTIYQNLTLNISTIIHYYFSQLKLRLTSENNIRNEMKKVYMIITLSQWTIHWIKSALIFLKYKTPESLYVCSYRVLHITCSIWWCACVLTFLSNYLFYLHLTYWKNLGFTITKWLYIYEKVSEFTST